MQKQDKGFTLIELLVVVLIIGILSAVALPQYQKVVEKSRATQALTILRALGNAANIYYMANGEYPTSFDELAVDMTSWTGNDKWCSFSMLDTRSNEQWSLQMYKTQDVGALKLYAGRLTGKYKGAGFIMTIAAPSTSNKYVSTLGQILCAERIEAGVLYEGEAGSYCNKLFKGTYFPIVGNTFRSYKLP